MLNVNVEAYESYKISTRPAVYKSLAQMLEYFNLHQNHLVYFNDEAEVSKLLGGLYNDRKGSDLATDTGYKDKIFVELDDDYSGFNDELDSRHKNAGNAPLMWACPITGASIRPIYNGRKFTVTLNKYFKDRVTAQTFHSKIRSAVLGSHLNSYFSLDTHYPLTNTILDFFSEIYSRLVKGGAIVEGPDMNAYKWFKGNALVPTDIITNLIGKNECFVFTQQLAENGLNYGTPNLAKITKGQYLGQYIVSWDYSFYWNIHTEWELRYPLQVYQQLIPTKYIPEVFEANKLDTPTNRFKESRMAKALFGVYGNIPQKYHVLPDADNWRPHDVYWLVPQLQVLSNMEDIPEQVIINIKNIRGFKWNDRYIHYIMKYRTKVTDRHHSPFNFKVYSDDTEILETHIELRENGDLVLLRPPTMKNIHRVVFSLDYALRLYTPDCIDDLLNDPEYGKWIISELFPSVKVPEDFGQGGRDDWWDIHNEVEVGDGEKVDFFPRGMMGFRIIAYNEDGSSRRPLPRQGY